MPTRPLVTVLTESFIIGIMNAVLILGLVQSNLKIDMAWIYLIGGALIHIIFEYTGGNRWWCEQTYKV
jgi:hypothetical protein